MKYLWFGQTFCNPFDVFWRTLCNDSHFVTKNVVLGGHFATMDILQRNFVVLDEHFATMDILQRKNLVFGRHFAPTDISQQNFCLLGGHFATRTTRWTLCNGTKETWNQCHFVRLLRIFQINICAMMSHWLSTSKWCHKFSHMVLRCPSQPLAELEISDWSC